MARQSRSLLRWTEAQLLVAPSAMTLVGLLTIALARRRAVAWSWGDLWVGIAFLGLVFAINASFGLMGFRGDQILLPVTVTLAGLGLLMAQRLQPALAASDPAYAGLAKRQAIYLGAGLATLWVGVVVSRRLSLLQRYKYTALAGSLALLVLTFVFGTEINGARLWITVGPVQAQPAEIVKITLVVFLAAYLDEKRDVIGSSWRLGFLRLPPIPYLVPMVIMWAASLLVLVVLNDLGTALLFFGIFLVMLYVASGRPVYVVTGLLAFAAGSWLAYTLFDRIGIRVQNWLDPWQDPLRAGYQQIQSDYALASGGVLGSGLGQGQPWRIPEVQTDFAFSAIGEELGLVGTTAVLALFFVLVMRGFTIALRTPDGFARLLAVGLSATIGLQALIIAGGVVRLIPLTGITLPFVSYGGSSLLTNFLIVGMLLNISGSRRPR